MQGKTVLITGGAKRVGAAISRRLHAAGAQLVVHYRNSAQEALALQIELNRQRANSVALVQSDLLDCANMSALIEATLHHFGRLDVLVHNASSFYATPLGGINETNWLDLIGTNLKAPLFLAQAAAAELRRTQGAIIHITDIHGEFPMENYVVYSTAKAGLIGLTRSLALEMGPEVRVNAISPGPILWPEDDVHFDHASRERIISHTLLKQSGHPTDIAETVYFLAAKARYITGQIINVDGGRSIRM
jgi:pteridine reductase